MKQLLTQLIKHLESLPQDQMVDAINEVKIEMHKISPFRTEPVNCVLWVKNQNVYANDYNPNSVAPPEMKLLEHSIQEDGYTQPIVTMLDDTGENREVIDGFHRNRVGKESEVIQERVKGYLPVVTILESREGKADRMAATIRHNRARGKHKVDAMSDIVLELKRRNWSDKKIATELGMDQDEILRLVQITGLAEMFSDHEFTEAWEAEILEDTEQIDG